MNDVIRLTTEELVTKFLMLKEISLNEPLGSALRTTKRQYTYFEVLCAWVDSDNKREVAATLLGFKDSKSLGNFMSQRNFPTNIGKSKQRRAYDVFMANSLDISYCDHCEGYRPVNKFPIINRVKHNNGLGNTAYRNFCDDCFYEHYQSDHNKEWKGKNKHKLAQYSQKRRALKAGVEVPLDEKEAIDEFIKNCPEGYEVDHIIPLSRGGAHSIHNLQYMLKQANMRKHMLTNEEWIEKCKIKGWDTGILPKNSS